MRGHIPRRGKSWRIKVRLGRDPKTGKRRQKWFTYPTRKEAEAKLAEMLTKINGGGMVPTTKLTVAEFLEEWLVKYAAGHVRETSLQSYRDIVRGHLIPALGPIPLRHLSPLNIDGYYTAKRNPPKPAAGKTPRALSAGTVRKHHAVLHAALQYAVKNGTLGANVCDRANPPKRDKKKPGRWDAEQVRLFLGEAKRSLPRRLYCLFLTLRTTGMRPGEALGLREQDCDLSRAQSRFARDSIVWTGVSVTANPPKTSSGRRRARRESAPLTSRLTLCGNCRT